MAVPTLGITQDSYQAGPVLTVAIGQAIPAGGTHFILISGYSGSVLALSSITDSKGNTYTIDANSAPSQSAWSVVVAHANITTALTATDDLTITYAQGWTLLLVQGLAYATAVEPAYAVGVNHTSGSAVQSQPVTFEVGQDGISFATHNVANQTSTVTGFTKLGADVGYTYGYLVQACSYIDSAAADSETATYTWSGGNAANGEIVGFAITPVKTVPSAPTNAAAVAGAESATVTYDAPASDGGDPITSYTATSDPGGFTHSTPDGTVAPIVVAGLDDFTQYTFTVHATNIIGDGPESAPSNPVTPNPDQPPGAPTNVIALPGDQQATVTYDAPANDGGTSIVSYTATSDPGGFTATQVSTVPVALTVHGLTNGIEYTFTVHADNEYYTGPESDPSPGVFPIPPPPNPATTPDQQDWVSAAQSTFAPQKVITNVEVTGANIEILPAGLYQLGQLVVAVEAGQTADEVIVSVDNSEYLILPYPASGTVFDLRGVRNRGGPVQVSQGPAGQKCYVTLYYSEPS